MKTQTLFNLLQNHPEKNLLFEYRPGKFVGANYHITEVKHIKINSVDCGSQTDNWNETIIQLWESPSEIDKTDFMSVYKALGILKKVGKMAAYDVEAEVKFEYSNPSFHTAQLFVNDYEINGPDLIFKLGIEQTDCKAKTECGVVEMVEHNADEEPCCSPDGNCC
ncbi:MAG: hypothetical protein HKN00_04340 [Flavobacteriaceae bacterium]|nr:hypothetical protein [Bacteroidia bacterium]NNF74391.1 hypothetical protein [Flavobacteriaceae bacterium]NNK72552.1 hypothetical protein [Flavobacteriaceae bacterium]